MLRQAKKLQKPAKSSLRAVITGTDECSSKMRYAYTFLLNQMPSSDSILRA
jgi:hypothetical protein